MKRRIICLILIFVSIIMLSIYISNKRKNHNSIQENSISDNENKPRKINRNSFPLEELPDSINHCNESFGVIKLIFAGNMSAFQYDTDVHKIGKVFREEDSHYICVPLTAQELIIYYPEGKLTVNFKEYGIDFNKTSKWGVDLFFVEMVYVEGGTFEMGSSDSIADDEEKPVHKVKLNSFYISKYTVTQNEYEKIMGNNPSKFKDPYRPVENVSWYDAVEYCNKKSELEGLKPCYTINKNKADSNNNCSFDKIKWIVNCNFDADGFRLPTEAEWEYAAKGGKKSQGYKFSGSDNIEEVAWYWKNSGKKKLTGDWEFQKLIRNDCQTRKIGQKKPNELGIYDMSGNVWEWCWDWFSDYSSGLLINPTGDKEGSDKIIRGGGWGNKSDNCRNTFRSDNIPAIGHSSLGFRLVRSK